MNRCRQHQFEGMGLARKGERGRLHPRPSGNVRYCTGARSKDITNAPSRYYPLTTSTIRWYLKDGRLSSVPEELKSHFLAMAYSMARTLPSCPFSAVFFEYKWRSQTYIAKVSFESETLAVDAKYQDVPRLLPPKNIRLGCSQTKNGTIWLVYRVK